MTMSRLDHSWNCNQLYYLLKLKQIKINPIVSVSTARRWDTWVAIVELKLNRIISHIADSFCKALWQNSLTRVYVSLYKLTRVWVTFDINKFHLLNPDLLLPYLHKRNVHWLCLNVCMPLNMIDVYQKCMYAFNMIDVYQKCMKMQ